MLNDYQRHIVERIYGFDIPGEGLVVRSIVIVATAEPRGAAIALAHRGRSFPVAIPPGYVGHVSAPAAAERYLNEALAPLATACTAQRGPAQALGGAERVGRLWPEQPMLRGGWAAC